MPKALTQRRDRGPAHPYPRLQISPPRRNRNWARQDTVDPGVVAHTAVHPVPPDLVIPADQALAGGGRPIQWFKVIMIAVAVVVAFAGYSAHRLFHGP